MKRQELGAFHTLVRELCFRQRILFQSLHITTMRSSYVAELTSASAADKLNFSPVISHQLAFLVFVFEIFTVTVVNALIARNFLHKFLVTNVTLFNDSHVATSEYSGFVAKKR